jgi:hypothetical protein
LLSGQPVVRQSVGETFAELFACERTSRSGLSQHRPGVPVKSWRGADHREVRRKEHGTGNRQVVQRRKGLRLHRPERRWR